MAKLVSVPLIAMALLAGACGSDDTTTANGSNGSGIEGPVPIVVANGAGGTGAAVPMAAGAAESAEEMASDSPATNDMALDSSFFGGWEYELADGLTAPVTEADGFRLDASDSGDSVAQIAAALGVSGDPVAVPANLGGGWRVGPEDGTAPMVHLLPNGEWWYQPQFEDRPAMEACTARPMTPEELEVTPEQFEQMVAAGEEPMFEECDEPEPPTGVPTAAQARERATALLADLGHSPDDYRFVEEYSDEWNASVTAVHIIDGVETPLASNFAFGGEARLEWASGQAGDTTRVGPYPLVDVEAAIERLRQHGGGFGGFGGFGGPAIMEAEMAECGPTDDCDFSTTDSAEVDSAIEVDLPPECGPDDACDFEEIAAREECGPLDDCAFPAIEECGPTDDCVVPGVEMPIECDPAADCGMEQFIPEPMVARLVSADLGLTMVFDVDGATWLLPAFVFTDAQGGTHTVAAVTDEFLVDSGETPAPAGEQPEPAPPAEVEPPSEEPGFEPGQPIAEPPPAEPEPTGPRLVDPDDGSTTPIGDEPSTPVDGLVPDGPPPVVDPLDEAVESPPADAPDAIEEPSPPPSDVPSEPDTNTDVGIEPIPQAEADALIGLTEAEAEDTAFANGWEVRLEAVDGELFALQEDFRTNRVNLTIVDGVVTAVSAW